MSSRHRFATLDGMRGIAALIVAASHVGEFVGLKAPPHADLAVDLFFVLSGFVLAHAYDERLAGEMTPLEFMRARLIRLHPLILFGSAISLASLLGRSIVEGTPTFLQIAWAAIAAVFLIPYHQLAWKAAFPLDGPAWSLFAEYAVNLLFAGVATSLGPRRLCALLIGGIAMLICLLGATGTVGDLWRIGTVWLSLLRVVFPFFAGVLVNRAYRSGLLEFPRLAPGTPICLLVAILLAPAGRFDALFEFAAIVLVFPLLVGASARDRLGPTGTTMMLWGGAMSYPLYILHFPIGAALARAAEAPLIDRFPIAFVGLTLVVVLASAWLTLRYFDEPVRSWLTTRHRMRRDQRVAA